MICQQLLYVALIDISLQIFMQMPYFDLPYAAEYIGFRKVWDTIGEHTFDKVRDKSLNKWYYDSYY